jgi:hypothetical protein
MKYLRWALGVLIGVWGLWSAYPLVMTALYKAHVGGEPPADVQKYVPLMQATPWWELLLWLATVLLLLTAAWRLFRNGRAFGPYALAFAVGMIHWGIMQSRPVYHQVFTAQELRMDYAIFAGEIVIGLLLWWRERRKSKPVTI